MKFSSYQLGIAAKYAQQWGRGIDPISRKTQFPSCFSNPSQTGALRILVDYTSTITNSGNTRVATNFTTAAALVVTGRGDRILMPGGASTVPDGTAGNGGTRPVPRRFEKSGFSLLFPLITGTYDPADPYNEKRDNILYHTWDMSYDPAVDKWTGINSDSVFAMNVAQSFYFVTNQIFKADNNVNATTGRFSSGVRKFGIHTLVATNGYGVEDCVFDPIGYSFVSVQSIPGEVNTVAPTAFAQNLTVRLCGFADQMAKNGSNCGGTASLNMVIEDNILLAAGNPTRTYLPDQEDAGTFFFNSSPGASNVGRVIQVNDTSTLLPGNMVSVTTSAGTGAFANTNGSMIMSIQDATHFLIDMAPPTALDGTTCVVSAFRIAPNIKRHNWYLDSTNRNMTLRRNVSIQDCSNNKFTGGPYTIEDHWNIRDPIHWITDPRGNATITQWPNNAPVRARRHTAVGSDDISINVGDARGWGPQLISQNFGVVPYWQNNTAYTIGNIVQRGQEWYICVTAGTSDNTNSRGPTGKSQSISDGAGALIWAWYAEAGGTTYNGGVLLNQNNPQGGGTGFVIASNHTGDAIPCYGEVRNSIMNTWSVNNTANIAQTTQFWFGNITDDTAGFLNTTVAPGGSSGGSTGSGNINRTALADPLINGLTSLTTYNTLRQFMPEVFSGVTIVNSNTAYADQRATEYNMFRLAIYQVQPFRYTNKMARLFRRTAGR